MIDIVERSGKFPVPRRVLHEHMLSLAESFCNEPVAAEDCTTTWNLNQLSHVQIRAIYEHVKEGRLAYWENDDQPGTIVIDPCVGLAEWWKKEVDRAEREGRKPKRTKPRKDEKSGDARVLAALEAHHQYEPANGSISPDVGPASNRGLAEKYGLGSSALTRFLRKKFDDNSYKKYEIACRNKKIASMLKLWRGDAPRESSPLRSEEYGRRDEED